MILTIEEFTVLCVLANAAISDNDVDAALNYPESKNMPRRVCDSLAEKGLLTDEWQITDLGVKLIENRAAGKLPAFDKIARSLTPPALRKLILACFNSLSVRHKNRKNEENPYYSNLMDAVKEDLTKEDFIEYYNGL